jgi:hypothetical protein
LICFNVRPIVVTPLRGDSRKVIVEMAIRFAISAS